MVCLSLGMLAACGGGGDDSESTPRHTATVEPTDEPTPADGLTENDRLIAEAIASVDIPYDMAEGTSIGDPNAPISLVVYEDFQCPHCLFYTAAHEPNILESWVATGQVLLEIRHFPILGPESVQAALASLCAADQDAFWQYHHALYYYQATEGQASDEELNVGRFSAENLKTLAAQLGLDSARFDPCLDDLTHAPVVEAQHAEAQTTGLRGTPGFVLNGEVLADNPDTVDEWNLVLVEALQD